MNNTQLHLLREILATEMQRCDSIVDNAIDAVEAEWWSNRKKQIGGLRASLNDIISLDDEFIAEGMPAGDE